MTGQAHSNWKHKHSKRWRRLFGKRWSWWRLSELFEALKTDGVYPTMPPQLVGIRKDAYPEVRVGPRGPGPKMQKPKPNPTNLIRPNGPKVREAILHVVRLADARGGARLTQYFVLKTLFFADQAHLNKYGRPITFDRYVAMKDGPVPSVAYDVLKGAIAANEEAQITVPLWSTHPLDQGKIEYFDGARDADGDVLSESDKEELELALERSLRLGWKGIWDTTHADKAYIRAWGERGDAGMSPMDYGDLLADPDEETVENVAIASRVG